MFRFFRKKTPPPPLSPLDQALQAGDYPAALSLLDAEVSLQSDLGKVFMALEIRLFIEDFEGALPNLETMLKLVPDNRVREEIQPLLENARVWCHRQTIADYPMERKALSAPPPPYAFLLMTAVQFHAKGETQQAKAVIASAKEQMPKIAGTLYDTSGHPMRFPDICDADDLTGPSLIGSHPQGLFYIPFEQMESITFESRQSFLDSIWNIAHIKMWTGDELMVRVPAYYVGTGRHESEPVRRLNMTVWDQEGGYAVAYGQRDLRFEAPGGKSMVLMGINQIGRIEFRRS